MNIKKIRGKKAQTWSIDLVLGVVIFLLVIVIVYSLIASTPPGETKLRDDADRTYIMLNAEEQKSSEVPNIIEGNSISEEELAELYAMNYQDLKQKLGITSDFCIVVVTDDNGIIRPQNGNASIGTGEDIVMGNTIYCGDN